MSESTEAPYPPQPQPPMPQYPPGYYPGYYAPVAPAGPGTSGLAIASMVLGILWLYWVGSILAIVFGFVALHNMKQATREGRQPQGGRGMAIAGVTLGIVGAAVAIVVVILVAVAASHSSGTCGTYPYTYSC